MLLSQDVKLNVLMPLLCPRGLLFLSVCDSRWRALYEEYLTRDCPKFRFKSTFGVEGSSHGQFLYPFFVITDKQGHIYVSDYSNNRIEIFNSVGQWKQSVPCSAGPNGMAFNSSNQLIVSCFDSHEFLVLDENLKESKHLACRQLEHPRGLAADTNDNVVVADAFNNRIQIFDRDGNWKQTVGKEGSGDGEFTFPWDVLVSRTDGTIFVSDCENHRIQVFNPDWKFSFQFGKEGEDDTEFNCPRGLALSHCGKYLLVCDSWNHRIQVFNAMNGAFIKSHGSNDDIFLFPNGICFSPSGQIIISECELDIETHRVQIFE